MEMLQEEEDDRQRCHRVMIMMVMVGEGQEAPQQDIQQGEFQQQH